MAQPSTAPWIAALQQRDPHKILMTMIVDALLSHPDGVAAIANRTATNAFRTS